MNYSCKDCDFRWTGTLYTFDQVREHEKTHLKNKKISVRCKVCNAPKNIISVQNNSDEKWECQNCGSMLDAQGLIAQ